MVGKKECKGASKGEKIVGEQGEKEEEGEEANPYPQPVSLAPQDFIIESPAGTSCGWGWG